MLVFSVKMLSTLYACVQLSELSAAETKRSKAYRWTAFVTFSYWCIFSVRNGWNPFQKQMTIVILMTLN